ncbi:MAG: hypothetical protein JW788_03000 [Candidatus Omnitrophica bacterium]|nr:hypothetical protein [Candidatus Omnitrophota bacterium]
MIRKAIGLFVLFAFCVALSGCHTVKGVVVGGVEGAQQDWEAAKRADKEMQEVLW